MFEFVKANTPPFGVVLCGFAYQDTTVGGARIRVTVICQNKPPSENIEVTCCR